MPRVFSIGQINNKTNSAASYITRSAVASAGLGATVQGAYELGNYLKNLKSMKKYGVTTDYLKLIPKSILSAAGHSALLGVVLSSAYILIDKIKNSKANNKNQ